MSFKNIPFGSAEEFNAVIEIPKGSANKYEYDEELDAIKLDFVFTGGFKFIHNYGYIPGTRGGDGDHMDAAVLSSHPLQIGTIVKCRPIGMVDLVDRGEEDFKIICIPVKDQGMRKYQSIKDLPEEKIEEFREFYKEIARQKNKIIEIREFADKDRTIEELKKSQI